MLALVTLTCGPGTLVTVYRWLINVRSRGVRLGAMIPVCTVSTVSELENYYRLKSSVVSTISMKTVPMLMVQSMVVRRMHSNFSLNSALAT